MKDGRLFFSVVFLNALIDLGHKIALQNTVFKVYDASQQIILVAIINACILLPFIALVIPVAKLADTHNKVKIMRATATASLLLTLAITVFYSAGWFWPAMIMTLLMAIQSAFYSPAKLAYLKLCWGPSRLSEANGWAQTASISGILMGTLAFSVGFEYLYSGQVIVLADTNTLIALLWPLGLVLVSLAMLQLYWTYRIPLLKETALEQGAINSKTKISSVSRQSLFELLSHRRRLLPVLCLALFWSVGQGMLAAFPAFAKAHAGINNTVVIQGVLATTGLGLALGAIAVGRLSGRRIELRFVPLGVVIMALGLTSLSFLSAAIAFAMVYFMMGIASACLIVPLNAYLQKNTPSEQLGGLIASSNFLQNIAMLAMLLLTIVMALWGIDSRYLLQLMAALTAIIGAYLSITIINDNRS
ncbi:MAG: hypothetical protein CL691_00840 [Cellvibrionales bacterium]|nr:hypothetical protein [Cellvibrionales bacterium]